MSARALARAGSTRASARSSSRSDIALELPQGARYALIGPNGAGKTTLINLITGMLRPDAGEILLGGEDITALAPEQRVQARAGAHVPDQHAVPATSTRSRR